MAKAKPAAVPKDIEPEAEVKEASEQVSLSEVVHLAQSSAQTLQTFLDQLDSSVGSDFHDIMNRISQTREDMRTLNNQSDDTCHITDAENELKLVVKATEDATNSIMEAAETIMTADPADPASYHRIVEENIMAIFEACSFQDITGQRINRVVETLDFVDFRVHKIAACLGIETEGERRDFDEVAFLERRQRQEDLILHGPQDEADAVDQSAIDDMF